jgi:hypothetical protein
MAQLYEVLFYDGYQEPPAYWLIDGVEGETPEQALAANLVAVTAKARKALHLGPDCEDEWIQKSLYVLRPGGLAAARQSGT